MVIKVTWPDIIDLLLKAEEHIVLIMPAIHEEWVDIIQLNKNAMHCKIKVCIDNSEDVIRNGYGSVKSLETLKNLNAEIKECSGLRVNFISVDGVSFCFFLESRILAGNPDGYNALVVEDAQATKIISQFFPESYLDSADEEYEIISAPLQVSKAIAVKQAIAKNPPEEPDLKRKIGTYNTLFQYAELHFEGANLSGKSISIPSDALPFKDVELKKRIKSRISLFTKEITDTWTELTDIKAREKELRKKYLIPCSIRNDKSILKKENKAAFLEALEELRSLAVEKKKILLNKVQTAINNSEDTLRNELTIFFNSVIPLQGENAKRMMEKEINKIIGKINLPGAASLISKINIEVMFYELTWEDLYDKKFNDWFAKNELISKADNEKIASFQNAFTIKK
jgi:hypothetical protein